jgi:hypothetical protein
MTTTPSGPAATLAALLAVLTIAACNAPNGGRPAGVSAGQVAACRARSEAIYRQQNRGDQYQGDTYATSTRDAPFGGAGLPSAGPASLGAQFGREKALNDCYNSGAGPSDTSSVTPAKP